ncbi:MAG: prepilin-type N-terminal cleavage/methylation domain-containing protein [Gemmatimonadota bacterium]|nr:prepilin-type N-terminal cleavage/methylation domain-containing protein [Gemmatimonadota bacterium]
MSARRGFTLLELLVALTVGGAALAAGGAAFATLVDQRAAARVDADAVTRALGVRQALEAWLLEARAEPGTVDALLGTHALLRSAAGPVDDDTLAFVTTADGETRQLRLFIDRAAARPALVVEQTDTAGAAVRTTLVFDVAGLSVSYYTTAFGRAEWRRTWAGGALLPAAIQVRLYARPETPLPVALTMPITVPLANGL